MLRKNGPRVTHRALGIDAAKKAGDIQAEISLNARDIDAFVVSSYENFTFPNSSLLHSKS
jgi:hypothetical protein